MFILRFLTHCHQDKNSSKKKNKDTEIHGWSNLKKVPLKGMQAIGNQTTIV
jgi:hypothetical protein